MRKWKGMLAVGVAASAATALSVAVSSPAIPVTGDGMITVAATGPGT